MFFNNTSFLASKMGSKNSSTTSTRSASGGSPRPTSSKRTEEDLKRSKHKSRLHLMSETGFVHKHEMSACSRVLRFIRLPHFSEYIMSVDHHQIWRRHLAWSLRDGDHLRNAVTSRFASNMVFMSLLLGTEIGVLFSPSKPANKFRDVLQNTEYNDPNFWAATLLCVSIGLTLSTLVANFTAWAIIGAVSPHNSHAILRSSVGLDAAQLPARLVILSIYCFLTWVMMFIGILVPSVWGILIALFPVALIAYIVVLYSSFGRLVIYSRAMQPRQIFDEKEEACMSSRRLFEELLKRAEKEKKKRSPLPLIYRSKRELSEKISDLMACEQDQLDDMGFGSSHVTQYVTRILDASGHHDVPVSKIADLLSRSRCQDDIEACNGGVPHPFSESQEEKVEEGDQKPGKSRSRNAVGRGYSYSDRDPNVEHNGESSKSMFHDCPGGQAMATLTL